MSEEKKKADAPADKGGHGEKGGDKAESAKGGGLMTKTPVLLGAVMIVEAVLVIGGMKMLGGSGPKPAAAAELATEEGAAESGESEHKTAASEEHDKPKAAEEGHGEAKKEEKAEAKEGEHGGGSAKPAGPVDRKKPVEIKVVDFRAPNKQSGRTYLYDVTILAVVKGANKDNVENTLKDREALIKDRVRTIIAQSDPEKLGGGSEPGLETLRRQVKYQLEEIVGEGVIDEVLVPRCIPFRADF